jgi:hypothetical protein
MEHTSNAYTRLQSENFQRTPVVHYARSKDLEYGDSTKNEDRVKYLAKSHSVYCYRNYPNRMGTPKRPPPRLLPDLIRNSTAAPRSNSKLLELLSTSPVSPQARSQLVKSISQASLKCGTSPRIVSMKDVPIKLVSYDDHTPASRHAYSRNKLGGFYHH